MIKYTEIFTLKAMLEKNDIPFVFSDHSFSVDEPHYKHYEAYQIEYPVSCCTGHRVCSVIQSFASYGNQVDRLEIMGLLKPEERDSDSVKGWLTAKDVFGRIKEHYENVNKNI